MREKAGGLISLYLKGNPVSMINSNIILNALGYLNKINNYLKMEDFPFQDEDFVLKKETFLQKKMFPYALIFLSLAFFMIALLHLPFCLIWPYNTTGPLCVSIFFLFLGLHLSNWYKQDLKSKNTLIFTFLIMVNGYFCYIDTSYFGSLASFIIMVIAI